MERVRRGRGGAAGRVASAYGRLITRLRWVVVFGWLTIAGACLALPTDGGGGSGGVEGFIPADAPAVQAEIREVRKFGFPLLARVAVVQRNPDGLTPLTQAEAVARAAAVIQRQYDDTGPILGAIPIPNTLGAFPGSRESDTTVITLLFMPPNVGVAQQVGAAREFVANHYGPEDSVIGVTGTVPALAEQGRVLNRSLLTVESATLAAIVLIVAFAFRSVLAPLLALATAGIAILTTLTIAQVIAARAGVPIPDELRPLLVALLLGVVTDYVIFYLFGLRREIAAGVSGLAAAERATARFTPIVTAAGITVACGTGALLVARSALFQAFGPAMAIAVLVGLAVAVTLVPALLAILGKALLWPGRSGAPGAGRANRRIDERSTWWVRQLVRPATAVIVLVGCLAVLVFAALPVRHLNLGLSVISSLPADNQVRQAAVAARAGFADGIISPTVLFLEAPDISQHREALAQLGRLLEQRPGVAGVLGPGDQPIPDDLGLVLSRDGNAARFLIVLDDQPLGATAIDTVAGLQAELPGFLHRTGLTGVTASFVGDTAIAEGVVSRTTDDLRRIAITALLANLVVLVLFLRALVAPLYLLAINVLALGATMGLTTWLFQDVLDHDGLTFYVPFAAAVLLLALGSDYTIFSVGHVWQEARRRPLPEALVVAVPQSARAITAAGVTLAVSFGLLALIPLGAFRQVAFAMAAGIALDATVVRSLLMPALLTLVGPLSGWPGRRLRRAQRAASSAPPVTAAGATRRAPLRAAATVQERDGLPSVSSALPAQGVSHQSPAPRRRAEWRAYGRAGAAFVALVLARWAYVRWIRRRRQGM